MDTIPDGWTLEELIKQTTFALVLYRMGNCARGEGISLIGPGCLCHENREYVDCDVDAKRLLEQLVPRADSVPPPAEAQQQHDVTRSC